MGLTNFISGVRFEHLRDLAEVRSLVRTISSKMTCLHYYGAMLIVIDEEIVLEIRKDYVSIIRINNRHLINQVLAGLGTGIEITMEHLIRRT